MSRRSSACHSSGRSPVAAAHAESIEFVRYSLTPWLRRIELAISNDGDLTFERQFVKFEVDGLLRADAATRSEVYSRALDPINGWLDVDEVRALEDLPPRQMAVIPSLAMAALPEAKKPHQDKSEDRSPDDEKPHKFHDTKYCQIGDDMSTIERAVPLPDLARALRGVRRGDEHIDGPA
jgi:hypothetical protein